MTAESISCDVEYVNPASSPLSGLEGQGMVSRTLSWNSEEANKLEVELSSERM